MDLERLSYESIFAGKKSVTTMQILPLEMRIPHSGFATRRNIDPSARRLKAIVPEEVEEEKIFDSETATAPENTASTEESSDRAFVETLESGAPPK